MHEASQVQILICTSCLQGTGTADEMALEERTTISTEGCVIADVAIVRPRGPSPQLQASTSGQDGSAASAEARPTSLTPSSLSNASVNLCNKQCEPVQ